MKKWWKGLSLEGRKIYKTKQSESHRGCRNLHFIKGWRYDGGYKKVWKYRGFLNPRNNYQTNGRHKMELKLGRDLNSSEWVVHLDGDRLNDKLSNLKIMTLEEKMAYIKQFRNNGMLNL